MAAAKLISVDAAIVIVLLENAGIFTLKEEQKNGVEGFPWWTSFGKSLVK